MDNRYVIEPGINIRNNKKCFYVIDSVNERSILPGLGVPIKTRTEAEYLAWVLNSQHAKEVTANGN
jgi:hypothetical protein